MTFKPQQILVACILLPALWCWELPSARADIYKYVDKYGRVYLTDRPEHAGYKRLVRTWKGWSQSRGAASVNYRLLAANRKRFSRTIAEAALERALPTALVHAVITAESAYDPNAVSTAGAVGLMQLMPATAERYGVRNRRDPVANIAGGTEYLKDLLGMFNNDLVLAIAAYNAGEGAVLKHGRRIPPYEETQTYVKRVLKFYDDYRKMSL
jgi:soluble lytic murein transglycosylase-like protein